MTYLNDHIEELDIEEALRAVSPQRRQYALRYRQQHDRKLSLAVYLLLCEALRKEYGMAEPPEFVFGPHGKPSLKGHPDIHFNLSHCRRAALCVVDDQPVGCDVECVPERLDMELCRYCFNDKEVAAIVDAGSPTLAFTELWTKKEAFLKLTGKGLTGHLPALLNTPEARRVSFHTTPAADNTFVYTIARMT